MVPLDARLFSDQLTPVTAYRTLVAADDREAPSFLFESVVNGTQTVRQAWRWSRQALGRRLPMFWEVLPQNVLHRVCRQLSDLGS